MSDKRPYIPLHIRVECAEKAVTGYPYGPWWPLYCAAVEAGGMTMGKRLMILLSHLPKGIQLDHDPALILRTKILNRAGEITRYIPDANDPAYLLYRETDNHLWKTTGRKPGAERTVTTKGSDIGLKTKFARLEGRKRPKQKIASRGFSKQKRSFRS